MTTIKIQQPIKSVCIDINWDLFWRPASPGLYTNADPRAQARWCHELGANVMQTFCVSYNGYAWFPSETAPVNPGLTGNFLQQQVEEARRLEMRVMGYFCLGSNPLWEMTHPDGESHDLLMGRRRVEGATNWIPFTNDYLDYFCASVRDALRKTEIDGFMIDWFNIYRGAHWLESEKRMWEELLGEKFPACGVPSTEAEIEFKRRQIERAWIRIRQAVQEIRPAIIWTNHPFHHKDDPVWTGHRLLREADWILNEGPDAGLLGWLEQNIGGDTTLIQNYCGWADHSAESFRDVDQSRYGSYGFTCVNPATCLPWTVAEAEAFVRSVGNHQKFARVTADARNIEILREAYRGGFASCK